MRISQNKSPKAVHYYPGLQYIFLLYVLLSLQRFHQQCNITHKQLNRDCQQNNTEKLTYDVDTSFSEKTLYPSGHAYHKKHPKHIQHQSDDDINAGIFGTQRQQSGKSTRTCQ